MLLQVCSWRRSVEGCCLREVRHTFPGCISFEGGSFPFFSPSSLLSPSSLFFYHVFSFLPRFSSIPWSSLPSSLPPSLPPLSLSLFSLLTMFGVGPRCELHSGCLGCHSEAHLPFRLRHQQVLSMRASTKRSRRNNQEEHTAELVCACLTGCLTTLTLPPSKSCLFVLIGFK